MSQEVIKELLLLIFFLLAIWFILKDKKNKKENFIKNIENYKKQMTYLDKMNELIKNHDHLSVDKNIQQSYKQVSWQLKKLFMDSEPKFFLYLPKKERQSLEDLDKIHKLMEKLNHEMINPEEANAELEKITKNNSTINHSKNKKSSLFLD